VRGNDAVGQSRFPGQVGPWILAILNCLPADASAEESVEAAWTSPFPALCLAIGNCISEGHEVAQSPLIESLRDVAGRSCANRYGVVFGLLLLQELLAQRRVRRLDQLIFELKNQDEGSPLFDELFSHCAANAVSAYGREHEFVTLEDWGWQLRRSLSAIATTPRSSFSWP